MGFYHQGLFWLFLFLTSDHAYPKTALTEELEGVELNKMGLIFRNGMKCHLPFPNTAVWGRIHLQIIWFFFSAATLQRVRALVIAFALLEWKTSTAFCMHSALYSLILVTSINRKGKDFHQPTFKAFPVKGKRIFIGFNHHC